MMTELIREQESQLSLLVCSPVPEGGLCLLFPRLCHSCCCRVMGGRRASAELWSVGSQEQQRLSQLSGQGKQGRQERTRSHHALKLCKREMLSPLHTAFFGG